MDSDDESFSVDVSSDEVKELTESLLEADVNNCSPFFTYNLQSRRDGVEDVSDEHFFQDVDMEAILAVPTVDKLMRLHDNYEPVVSEEEEVTREEIDEEWAFLQACLDTKVFDILRQFMVKHSLLGKMAEDKTTFIRFLHRMWFSLYPRSHRRHVASSCAFEHVFLGEVKRGNVNGFHNWLFFLMQEREGAADYFGFNYCLSFGRDRGAVVKTVLEWKGMVKPVTTIFVGLSPELELALYTLCALLKSDGSVEVSMGDKTFEVRNHVFWKRGKKYLASAYPDL